MMKLSVVGKNGSVSAQGEKRVHLVYLPAYRPGDTILLEVDAPGLYKVRLEDTLPPAVVYLSETQAHFPIPFGNERGGYSPRAFIGKRHFIEAEKADDAMAQIRRNLAFNPFDGTKNRGMYPHMTLNVKYEDSLRNKLLPNKGLFAPRCVIDGFLANESHRLYPHQSWGINRNPNAWLTCEFGRAVDIDCVRLAIRGEFPHDNYWVQATLRCSDKSEEIIHLQKTLDIQSFPLTRHGITSLTLCELMMSDEPSPFPALSLLEIYGKDAN